MNLQKLRFRTLTIITLIVVILSGFTIQLFANQVIRGDYYRNIGATRTGVVPIPAARGIILDRNGVPLVVNETSLSLVFEAPFFPSVTEHAHRNEIILSLIELFEEHDAEWIDMLPLALVNGAPVFLEERERDIADMMGRDFLRLNEYATAQNVMDALIEEYKLEEFDLATAHKLASVQYNMRRSDYRMGNPYAFATHICENLKSRVMENSAFYQGVSAQIVPVRHFIDGALAPHILGRVANINPADFEKYRNTDDAYRITDDYGAFGIERAAQPYLRGKEGQKTITIDRNTGEASEIVDRPAVQGDTVILSIDSVMQKMIEENFPQQMRDMPANRYTEVPVAGAVVVIDVHTGEILASVSYPGYDITQYQMRLAEWSNDETAPLWNRALQGTYEPGSTAKVSVSLAALQEGEASADFHLRCTGTYRFLDMTFNCPQLFLHRGRPLNHVRALVDSCNSFYYEMGRRLGYARINAYRLALGLGQHTGVELPEQPGIMDSEEFRRQLGQNWYAGNNLQTAIGQGNLFTPIQLAVHTATVANKGARMQAHFIQSIRRAGSNELVRATQPEVLGNAGIDHAHFQVVHQAMMELCTNFSSSPGRFFVDLPVIVAGKTGTAQVTRQINGRMERVTNGIFMSFAPYDNPEIAIISVGEGCKSSVPVVPIHRDIYQYYFGTLDQMARPQRENVLL